jgi:phosphatidylethanolamine-binding protein (PEBP) family uncharacterized protein
MRVLLDCTSTYQRLLALATGFVLLTGCGGDKNLDKPLPKASGAVTVTAPWRDGGRIPREYTCDGANRQPTVKVSRTGPGGTAIVMTDPDAPGGTFVHWTRWGTTEGHNSFGKVGYDGPCPPKGDRAHHYVLTAYVLKQKLGLPRGAEPEKVVAQIRKVASASGSITGLYDR